jgi:hypothetical protein
MKVLRAQVIANNCGECRDQLLLECRQLGLPLPTGEFISVPQRWAFHKCTHIENGLVLKFESKLRNGLQLDVEDDTPEHGTEVVGLESCDSLDASKGIGYPCREEGGYGSYPSHDGFDDESEP